VSTQLKIWKRLITNQLPLSCHRPSIAISLLPSLPFYANSHIKLANFCNQIATPSTTPPDRGIVSDFLISKCGLTDKAITKAFRHDKYLLRAKSTQNLEEVLELLNGCGLTTPAQVRKVVLCNPKLLFRRSERNVKSKLSFLRTFIKEEDIFKLVINDASIFDSREEKLKSRTSLLLSLGLEGNVLSYLVARQPRLLNMSEEKVMEIFKQVENLGFKKGTKLFALAVSVFSTLGKETLERKLQCLRNLGFSEKQISGLSRANPQILKISEEKMKRIVDFVVNSVGLPLADLVKYRKLFDYSLDKRLIPRYRVMEALKSMQVQELKREKSLPEVFYLKEEQFLEKHVINNPESSILLDIYHDRKDGRVTINKETCSECALIKGIHGSSESLSGLST